VREAPARQVTAHDSDSAAQTENCGCEPFTVVSKDPQKFKICTDRANKIGKLNTPRKIYDFMAPDVVNKPYEEFYVLGIGAHGEFEGKLITYARVAQGGQHKVNVETEEIARILLADRPDVYILAHNHPSNNADPSDGDIELTESVKVALKKSCPNIVFGDHIILAANSFYSFRADGGKGKLFKV
jgi:DNA repair protein RadC